MKSSKWVNSAARRRNQAKYRRVLCRLLGCPIDSCLLDGRTATRCTAAAGCPEAALDSLLGKNRGGEPPFWARRVLEAGTSALNGIRTSVTSAYDST